MRRLLVALLVAAALVVPTPARAGAARACPQRATSVEGVRALIRCAAPRMGVSTATALSVARRESRFHPGAHNPHSSACGVYQIVSGTWRYFVASFVYGHSLGTLACENGRANVLLSLRYVKRFDWGPWS